ncbi:MAG: hypothetical protein U0575_01345 [Phycisphaerales bacterium]
MPPLQLNGPDGLLRGVTWSGALALSLVGIAAVGAVLVAKLPTLSEAVVTPTPNDARADGIAALMPEHEKALDTAQKRFVGRYLFYPPPAPKPPPAPRPPPEPKPIEVVKEPEPPKAPATYQGKKPSFVVGDEVYFVDSSKLRVGEEHDGVKLISASTWSIKVAHQGGEYDVPIADFKKEGEGGSLGGVSGDASATPWLLGPGHEEDAFIGLKASAASATPAAARGPGKMGDRGKRGEDPVKREAEGQDPSRDHGDGAPAEPAKVAAEVPPPMSKDEIEKMDRPAALAALSKVSRAKNNKDLDEPTKKRLEEEFRQLMDQVKKTAAPPSK